MTAAALGGWLGVTACVSVAEPVAGEFDAAAVSALSLAAPRGRVEVGAGPEGRIVWEGALTARAPTAAAARARLEASSLDVGIASGVAHVHASLSAGTSADLSVSAPPDLQVTVAVARGEVVARDRTGGLVVSAGSATLWDIAGAVDAEILGGIGMLRLHPEEGAGARVRVEHGEALLLLPAGRPYWLTIEGSPDASWSVGALGLTEVVDLPGRFEGRSGDASVRVHVEAWSSTVSVDGF